MTTLAAVVGLAIAGFVALLFVPVRAQVRFDSAAVERRLWWRVRWVLLTFGSDERGRTRKPKADRPKRGSDGKSGWRGAGAAMATPGLVPPAGRLLGRMLTVARPREVDAVVRIGLDDPASTGILYGRLAAVAATASRGWSLRVEPDFEEPVLAGHGAADWSVAPVRVLWPLLTFLAAPPVWRAGRAALKARRRRT